MNLNISQSSVTCYFKLKEQEVNLILTQSSGDLFIFFPLLLLYILAVSFGAIERIKGRYELMTSLSLEVVAS